MFVDTNPQRYFWKAVLEDGTVFPEQVSDYRSLNFDKIVNFDIYGEFGFNASNGSLWFRDQNTGNIDSYIIAIVGKETIRKVDQIIQFKDSIADLSGVRGTIKKHTIGYVLKYDDFSVTVSQVLDVDSQKRWIELLVESKTEIAFSVSITKNGSLFFSNSANLEGQNIMVVEV